MKVGALAPLVAFSRLLAESAVGNRQEVLRTKLVPEQGHIHTRLVVTALGNADVD